jgi:hypothetical protein
MQTIDKSSKCLKKKWKVNTKVYYKNYLQKPIMNASAIFKLFFGSIDPYKKDNVHQKQFVEILGLLVIKNHLPI